MSCVYPSCMMGGGNCPYESGCDAEEKARNAKKDWREACAHSEMQRLAQDALIEELQSDLRRHRCENAGLRERADRNSGVAYRAIYDQNSKLIAEHIELREKLSRLDAYLTMHPGDPEEIIRGALSLVRGRPSSDCKESENG